MKPKEILAKILEETYILSGALDIQDIDMILVTLERRNDLIQQFKTYEFDRTDQELIRLIHIIDDENRKCIEKMGDFRASMEVELRQVKTESKKMKQTQKVHEQYSNPYANDAVGNAFDLKK